MRFVDQLSRRRGQLLIGYAPFGHWNTSTFLGSLRHDRIVAPLVLDGATNRRSFRAYIEQLPAPTLSHGTSSSPTTPAVTRLLTLREAIAARAATLRFLPPYSLHLNPIERVFAKLKTLLQQAELPTRERPWNTIASTLHRFISAECQI